MNYSIGVSVAKQIDMSPAAPKEGNGINKKQGVDSLNDLIGLKTFLNVNFNHKVESTLTAAEIKSLIAEKFKLPAGIIDISLKGSINAELPNESPVNDYTVNYSATIPLSVSTTPTAPATN